MRFKVGDIVKISKKSGFYGENRVNPKNTAGEFIEINIIENTYPIKVIFDNTDYSNCFYKYTIFNECDLKLVRRKLC